MHYNHSNICIAFLQKQVMKYMYTLSLAWQGCEPFTLKNNLVPVDTVTMYVYSDINSFQENFYS